MCAFSLKLFSVVGEMIEEKLFMTLISPIFRDQVAM
jgi:hypothetical protein